MVHFNAYTHNIEIIDSKSQLEHLARDIESKFGEEGYFCCSKGIGD